MSKLSSKRRNALSDSTFVFPGERRYPIPDKAHARNALARSSGKAEEGAVRKAVHAKFPDIGEKVSSINPVMLESFADEMEKISAGFLQNVGGKIISSARGLGGTVKGWGGALRTAPRRTLESAKYMAKNPRQALKEGWHATWHDPEKSGGRLGKALFLGGTALQASTVVPEKDPTGRGESRLTRAARFGTGTLTGMAGLKHGLIPSMAMGIVGDVAGGAVGRSIDRVRGYKQKASPSVLPNAHPVVVEHAPAKPLMVAQSLSQQG